MKAEFSRGRPGALNAAAREALNAGCGSETMDSKTRTARLLGRGLEVAGLAAAVGRRRLPQHFCAAIGRAQME
jgi:hypothetical protein